MSDMFGAGDSLIRAADFLIAHLVKNYVVYYKRNWITGKVTPISVSKTDIDFYPRKRVTFVRAIDELDAYRQVARQSWWRK